MAIKVTTNRQEFLDKLAAKKEFEGVEETDYGEIAEETDTSLPLLYQINQEDVEEEDEVEEPDILTHHEYVGTEIAEREEVYQNIDTDDVRANVRILVHQRDEGVGLLYDGSIFKKIPVHQAYSYLITAYHKETESKKTPNRATLKQYFSDLFITETDKDMAEILMGRNGRVYNLKKLRDIRENGYSQQDTSWIENAEQYKNNIPTQKLGAKYIFPQNRHKESAIIAFLQERIVGTDNFDVYMTAIAKGLVLKVVTKNVFVIINPVKNTGKTTQSKLIQKMYGDYATAIKSITYISSDNKEEESMKFFYQNKHIRFMIFEETARDTVLDESIIKRLTGRNNLPVPYQSNEKTFNVNFQLFGGGSNEPFAPQQTGFTLKDRIFYFPFGKIISPDKCINNYEDILGEKEELDLFFSYLIDNYYPQAVSEPIKRTQAMVYIDEYARLLHEPARLFLDRCCLRGVSDAYSKIQRYTCTEVYTLFTNFIRLYGIYLIKTLHFNYDDNGYEMDNNTILGLFRFPTYHQFKKLVDTEIGSATEKDRTNKGYRWANLFIKAPLVYFYNENNIKDFSNNFDKVLAKSDEITTMDAAVRSWSAYTQPNSNMIPLMMTMIMINYL